jgi:hypothetical protein
LNGNGNTDPLEWLVGEGLIPLLGASVLYVVIRAGGWIMSNAKPSFKFYLGEALDPMGWLYGGAVLAFQTAIRRGEFLSLRVWLVIEGAVCLMLLVLAMVNRAESKANQKQYVPDKSAGLAAGVLVAGILYTGFLAYH